MGKYEGIETKFLTPVGILSFPALFKARAAVPTAAPKYGATILLPKGRPDVDEWAKRLKASIIAIKTVAFKDKDAKPEISVLKDGDTATFQKGKNKGKLRKEINPEVAGHWIVTASKGESSEYPHRVVDHNMNDITNPALVYAGCQARMEFGLFAYDKGDIGIAAGMDLVQKAGEGKPLSSGGGTMAGKLEQSGLDTSTVDTVDDDAMFN